jgi:hypothetical protein
MRDLPEWEWLGGVFPAHFGIVDPVQMGGHGRRGCFCFVNL